MNMDKKMNLTEALKKYFGFDKFKGDQERIMAESRYAISCPHC